MSKIHCPDLKTAFVALGTAAAVAGAVALPHAVAHAADTPVQIAACNPCNPCNPCAAN